ncbi:MAG: DUF4126 domain-containing protein, partial [Rhodoferax sp.]|nr:DUF4126 domain-containing protein [Rhodoferax sp.]
GWASGLRLYAVLFMTGLAGLLGWIALPQGLHVLQHPAMLVASGGMLSVEFLADKIPGLDSLWDMVHAVIRVPGGAALAAAVFGADNTTMAVVAGVLGGSLAATSYAGKATTRAAVNTSPEPFSNVAVSLLEDGLVVAALWLAVQHPLLFAVALTITLVLTVLLIAVLFKFLRAIVRRLTAWFSPSPVY